MCRNIRCDVFFVFTEFMEFIGVKTGSKRVIVGIEHVIWDSAQALHGGMCMLHGWRACGRQPSPRRPSAGHASCSEGSGPTAPRHVPRAATCVADDQRARGHMMGVARQLDRGIGLSNDLSGDF